MRKHHSRGTILSKVLLVFLVAIMLVLFLFPVVAMIGVSLKTNNEVFQSPVTWFPEIPQWDNYVETFRRMDLLNGFKNSSIVG